MMTPEEADKWLKEQWAEAIKIKRDKDKLANRRMRGWKIVPFKGHKPEVHGCPYPILFVKDSLCGVDYFVSDHKSPQHFLQVFGKEYWKNFKISFTGAIVYH